MTQDQGLAGLLGRVEACVGADREIDCALAIAVGGFFIRGADPRERPLYCFAREDGTEVWPGQAADMLVPFFTASLDAALALCTRVLPGWNWRVEHIGGKPHAAVWRDMGECGIADAKTPALTLIAAMLRALISKSSESGEGDRASRGEGVG